MKNPIEILQERIEERFPAAVAVMDPPGDPQGSWWLDVRSGEQELNIEWLPRRGFGVNARPDALFGEGNDEVYASPDEAFERIRELIETGGRTKGAPEPGEPRDQRSHAA